MATQTGSIDLKAQVEAHDAASQTASKYITEINNDGIMVHPDGEGPNDTATPTGWHIGAALEYLRQGIARFWIGLKNSGDLTPTVRIGASNESHVEIDYHSLQFIDKESSTYFYVSDLRGEDGTFEASDSFTGADYDRTDGITLSYQPVQEANTTSVFVNGTEYAYYSGDGAVPAQTYWFNGIAVILNPEPEESDTIQVDYLSADSQAKAFTFGSRVANSKVGRLSAAVGEFNSASGEDSAAFGNLTTASGMMSFASGRRTTASGSYSHVEGVYSTASGINSHAEGSDTTASGYAAHTEGGSTTASSFTAHAEGWGTTASGGYSHAQNNGTIAAYDSQTAIGKCNDNQSTNAFEIGNGRSIIARSNALTVDWDGNVRSAGNLLYLDAGNYGTAHTYLEAVDYDTGATGTRVGSTRNVSGTDIYNNINLNILADGTRQVRFSNVVPWQEALDTHYLPGDTISGSCRAGGYVTNSAKDIRWTIPFSKPISGSVSCTSMSMTVRMAGTYIYGTSSGNASVPVSSLTYEVTPSGIDCQYRASSAIIGATNNSECSVQVTYSFTVS